MSQNQIYFSFDKKINRNVKPADIIFETQYLTINPGPSDSITMMMLQIIIPKGCEMLPKV